MIICFVILFIVCFFLNIKVCIVHIRIYGWQQIFLKLDIYIGCYHGYQFINENCMYPSIGN